MNRMAEQVNKPQVLVKANYRSVSAFVCICRTVKCAVVDMCACVFVCACALNGFLSVCVRVCCYVCVCTCMCVCVYYCVCG